MDLSVIIGIVHAHLYGTELAQFTPLYKIVDNVYHYNKVHCKNLLPCPPPSNCKITRFSCAHILFCITVQGQRFTFP